MTRYYAGYFAVDALEFHAVTAVVAGGRAHRDRATGELIRDDLRQFSHAVVLGSLSHIEDLATHRGLRREQTAVDGLADILDVYHRAPGTAVARHDDASAGPGQRAQIVQDDVEAHARRGAERRGVAQQHRAEMRSRHGAQVTLHQHLAFGVGGLRIDARVLVEKLSSARAIDAAGGGVDEAPDARTHTFLCECHRAVMVEPVHHLGIVLSERIVG